MPAGANMRGHKSVGGIPTLKLLPRDLLHARGGARTERGHAGRGIRATTHIWPLETQAPHTHRETRTRHALHSQGDDARLRQYRAPGSPRGQLEHMYVRSNQHGLRDVRLIARAEADSLHAHKSPRQRVAGALPWDCPRAVGSPMAYLRLAGPLPPLGNSKLPQLMSAPKLPPAGEEDLLRAPASSAPKKCAADVAARTALVLAPQ